MRKLFFLLLFFAFTEMNYAQNIIIKDINLITMLNKDVIIKQSVLIKDGKINMIGNYLKLPKNQHTQIINGKGKYLMPALTDMHVHLPEENKIEKLLLSNVAAGITHIRVMNSVAPQLKIRENLSKKIDLISPKVHYSHLIKSNETFTQKQSDSLMRQLINDKIKFVKLISLSNEETFNNLTKAANEYHITIGGHYPAYQKDGKTIRIDIEKVIKSNFKSIEHLAGYISINNDDQLVKAINMTKEYDIYNCPTLDWDIMAYHLQYPTDYQSRLTLQFLPNKISDLLESDYKSAIEKAGGKEKTILAKEKYKAVFDLKLKVLHQLYVNNCLLLMGSDPGNNLQVDGFNIYEEMQNWSKAGIDNFTILKSATINPSRFFLEDDKWGSIEEGKNAELLILQRNPLTDIKNITTIEKTIIGQKVYHNKTLIKLL